MEPCRYIQVNFSIHYKMVRGGYPFAFMPNRPPYPPWLEDVLDWCRDQFGRCDNRYMVSGALIYFQNEDDAFSFKMRWG